MSADTNTSTTATSAATTRQHLPLGIWVLTAGTFLMGTTEFVVAGLLPEVAHDYRVSVADAGLAITVFAVGMIVGAPSMALLTLRLPRRLTLMLALGTFAFGHVIVAVASDFTVMLIARFITALATGAFWAVAAVVAAHLAGTAASSRALGVVLGGGMLANVVGVPLGSFGGQVIGWRGPFWVLAGLALVAVVAVVRVIPAEPADRETPSVRAELRSMRSGRIWLTLAVCAAVNASVLTVYSFISPLLTDRTRVPAAMVPLALALFGAAALIGSIVGGRSGDHRPFRTPAVTAAISLVACAGLWVFSAHAPATFGLFALLGLVGLSANPVLVALVVRYGASAPTLPSAMATSMFNLGTAVGTGVAGPLLDTKVGDVAPLIVGTIAGALVFVPLILLVVCERRR